MRISELRSLEGIMKPGDKHDLQQQAPSSSSFIHLRMCKINKQKVAFRSIRRHMARDASLPHTL